MKNKMRATILGILLATLGMGVLGMGQDVASDAEILKAMDQHRFLDPNTGYVRETMEIYAQRPDSVNEATVRLSIKSGDDEEFRLRIDFLEPEESAGQAFLILPDETVLLCTPDLAMPLRISGGTDVFGDSTVSTTAGINFADAYEIRERADTTLNDTPVLQLELEAIGIGTAYPSATVWVDPITYEPLEAVLYALSGEPLNRIIYESYVSVTFGDEEEGIEDRYVTVQIIENLIQEGYTTRLTITDFSVAPIPNDLLDENAFCTSP